MKEKYIGKLVFEGYKSFDTLEEAEAFSKKLGDGRCISITECVYPDLKFYIVQYDTPTVRLVKE